MNPLFALLTVVAVPVKVSGLVLTTVGTCLCAAGSVLDGIADAALFSDYDRIRHNPRLSEEARKAFDECLDLTTAPAPGAGQTGTLADQIGRTVDTLGRGGHFTGLPRRA